MNKPLRNTEIMRRLLCIKNHLKDNKTADAIIEVDYLINNM